MTLTTSRRPWARAVTVAIAAMATGVLLAACSSNGATTSTQAASGKLKNGGTMTVALNGTSIGSLDPALANTLVSVGVLDNMCQALYDDDSSGAMTPDLAAGAPEFGSDRTSATIRIRPDVKFQDGTAMDAEAVKETIDRNLTLASSQRKGDLAIVKSVDVINPTTLKVLFNGPVSSGAFQDAFTSRGAIPVSPKAVAAEGSNFASHPVCVGPFKLTSQTTNTVTLTRDTKYYYAPSSVHLDKLILKVVADPSVRLTNLQSGQFNVIQALSPKDLSTAKSNASLKVDQAPGRGYVDLIVNTETITSPGVRKALEESIDKAAIAKTVWGDIYTPACTFMPPQQALATPQNTACVKYDPAQAKKDIAAAGVKTPIPATLEYSTTAEFTQMATLIQAMAEKVGFKITLKPTDTATALSDTEAGKNDLYINQWTGTADPAGDIMLTPGTFENMHNWNNAELNALYAKIMQTTDPATLKGLYNQVVAVIQKETPVIYLVHNALLNAQQKSVSGLGFTADGSIIAIHAGFTS